MLSILHNKINNIVPIIGIEDTGYSLNIEYVDPNSITNEQTQQIQDILINWPLESAKINKILLLDYKWNNFINNGFDTTYGWKLGLTTTDIALLTGSFLLAKEAQLLDPSQQVTIVDLNGVSHDINIVDFTNLMIQYGQYRANLSSWYANIKNQIELATTFEELNNIVI